jgi:hypothetical protein
LLHIDGSPASSATSARGRAWRAQIAEAALDAAAATGLALRFTLEPGRCVDLDTVTEVALAGLRDAGVLPRGLRCLDVILATRIDAEPPGLVARFVEAAQLASITPPGPVLLDAPGATLPRTITEKRVWRGRLAEAWTGRDLLDCLAWADVAFTTRGSLAGPLEPTLDALEPVLGRDPRAGRQGFFPNDHLLHWLRVRRAGAGDPPVHLRLGTCS